MANLSPLARLSRHKRGVIAVAAALASGSAMAEPVTAALTWIGTAVGASAASAAAVGSLIVTTAVTVASQAYAKRQASKKARQAMVEQWAQDLANIKDRTATIVSTDAAWRIVYGSPAPVGGMPVAQIQHGAGQEFKSIVMIFAAHECDAIEDIYIDGVACGIGPAGGWSTAPEFSFTAEFAGDPSAGPSVHASYHLSPDGVDVADAGLIASLVAMYGPDQQVWTEAHRLSGYTYAVVTLNQVHERFQGGLPQITAKLRGKKVYDYRTGQTAYSRNPALCEADFLRAEYGYGAELDQLDVPLLIASANACDRPAWPAGAEGDGDTYGWSRALYAIDGAFDTSQDREATRRQIEDAMAGQAMESAGVWRIMAGGWTTPVMTIGPLDLVAPSVLVQSCNPSSMRFNGAAGSYINAAGNGQSEEFKGYSNPTFRAQDVKAKLLQLNLPMVGSHQRCHQVARVKVERSRGGMTLNIFPKMIGLRLQPGDRIYHSDPFLGFEGKTFIVQDWTYAGDSPVGLVLEEDWPEAYDEADETRPDPAPNTTLPNPFAPLDAPAGLQVESGDAQAVSQGTSLLARARVSWVRCTDVRVLRGGNVAVEWRADDAAAGAWQPLPALPGDAAEIYVYGLEVGRPHQVRVRFETVAVHSPWAMSGHTLDGKGPAAAVGGLDLVLESDGIHAEWEPPEGNDLIAWTTTALRRGEAWDTGAPVYEGRATRAALGWAAAGLLRIWASHRTGALWSEPVNASLLILPPVQPLVEGEVQGRSVSLRWGDCRTTQPIAYYEIGKGPTADAVEPVSRTGGLSFQTVEPGAGIVRYWVRAVDAGGNAGAWGSRQLMTLAALDDVPDISRQLQHLRSRVEVWRDHFAASDIGGLMRAENAVADSNKTQRELLTVMESKFSGSSALFAQDVKTLAAQGQAYAQIATGISARVGAAEAAILEERTVRATEYEAMAELLDIMSASVGAIEAAYVNQIQLNASLDAAIAHYNTVLQASVPGGLSAQVAQQATAMAGIDGNLGAQFMLQTILNSASGKRYIAGLRTNVTSTNGGETAQSEMVFLADDFVFLHEPTGTLEAPFEVVDNVTRIKTAVIGHASIGTLQVAGGAIFAPMVSSGDATAGLHHVINVPAGQVWTCTHIVFCKSGNSQLYLGAPAPSYTALTSAEGEPVPTGLFTGNDVGAPIYRPGPTSLAHSHDLSAGSYTVRLTAGVDSSFITLIGKRGA